MDGISDDVMMELGAGDKQQRLAAVNRLASEYGLALTRAISGILARSGVPKKLADDHLEDLYQEVLKAAWVAAKDGSLYDIQPNQRVEYFFGIARKVVLMSIRSNRRYRNRFCNNDDEVNRAEAVVREHCVNSDLDRLVNDYRECLKRLGPQERRVVDEQLGVGKERTPTSELAADLNIAPDTLYAYLSTGRAKLQDCMRSKGHGPILSRKGK